MTGLPTVSTRDGPQRGWAGRVWSWARRGGLPAWYGRVALGGAMALSYVELLRVAEAAGIPDQIAWLYPLTVDMPILAAVEAIGHMIATGRWKWRSMMLSWAALLLFLAYSVWGNMLAASGGHDELHLTARERMAVSGAAPVSLLATHLVITGLAATRRRETHDHDQDRPAPTIPVGGQPPQPDLRPEPRPEPEPDTPKVPGPRPPTPGSGVEPVTVTPHRVLDPAPSPAGPVWSDRDDAQLRQLLAGDAARPALPGGDPTVTRPPVTHPDPTYRPVTQSPVTRSAVSHPEPVTQPEVTHPGLTRHGGDSPVGGDSAEGESPWPPTSDAPARSDSARGESPGREVVIHRGGVAETLLRTAVEFDGDAEARMALLWHLSGHTASGRELARVGAVSDATGIRRARQYRTEAPPDPRHC